MTNPSMIVACPACATLNRVPPAKLSAGGKCGRCGTTLFQGRPLELGSRNIEAHASKSELPIVVDFWASWCVPCRPMAPAFEAAAAQLEPEMRLAKCNTETEPELAARFGISSIPTIIAISRGRELARQAGALPAAAIVS